MSGKVVAVLARKGGVGKTTIVAHLAGVLAELGHSVIVLDTDPQASLAAWAGLGDGTGLLSRVVERVATNNVERFRATVETASRRADRVLIDTPPGFDEPALLAALVADLVLIPSTPSPLDMLAARDALVIAEDARRQRGGQKPVALLVPSKVTATTLGRELAEGLEALGAAVLPAIGQRTAFAAAAFDGRTVLEHAGSSVAAEEVRALGRAVEKELQR